MRCPESAARSRSLGGEWSKNDDRDMQLLNREIKTAIAMLADVEGALLRGSTREPKGDAPGSDGRN